MNPLVQPWVCSWGIVSKSSSPRSIRCAKPVSLSPKRTLKGKRSTSSAVSQQEADVVSCKREEPEGDKGFLCGKFFKSAAAAVLMSFLVDSTAAECFAEAYPSTLPQDVMSAIEMTAKKTAKAAQDISGESEDGALMFGTGLVATFASLVGGLANKKPKRKVVQEIEDSSEDADYDPWALPLESVEAKVLRDETPTPKESIGKVQPFFVFKTKEKEIKPLVEPNSLEREQEDVIVAETAEPEEDIEKIEKAFVAFKTKEKAAEEKTFGTGELDRMLADKKVAAKIEDKIQTHSSEEEEEAFWPEVRKVVEVAEPELDSEEESYWTKDFQSNYVDHDVDLNIVLSVQNLENRASEVEKTAQELLRRMETHEDRKVTTPVLRETEETEPANHSRSDPLENCYSAALQNFYPDLGPNLPTTSQETSEALRFDFTKIGDKLEQRVVEAERKALNLKKYVTENWGNNRDGAVIDLDSSGSLVLNIDLDYTESSEDGETSLTMSDYTESVRKLAAEEAKNRVDELKNSWKKSLKKEKKSIKIGKSHFANKLKKGRKSSADLKASKSKKSGKKSVQVKIASSKKSKHGKNASRKNEKVSRKKGKKMSRRKEKEVLNSCLSHVEDPDFVENIISSA